MAQRLGRLDWVLGLALGLVLPAFSAWAEAPKSSSRPHARPVAAAPAAVTLPEGSAVRVPDIGDGGAAIAPGDAAQAVAPGRAGPPRAAALLPIPYRPEVPPALRAFAPDPRFEALARPAGRAPGAAGAEPPAAAAAAPELSRIAAPVPVLPDALAAFRPDDRFAALRPRNRDGDRVADPVPEAEAVPVRAEAPALRPKRRPDTRAVVSASAVPAGAGERLIAAFRRPEARPQGLARRAQAPERVQPAAAIRPAPGTGPVTGRRGAVCGIPGIQGEAIAPIVGRVQGCGVANPVRVTAVAGLRLSQPATMDCDTARALHSWIESGLKPAMGRTGGGVAALQIAGHYVCRTRNHKKGARVSEHGKGRAVDISAIVLANGQKLSVLRDWRGPHGAKMKAAYRAACGTFGTTLGPGSDGYHEDHFHFDTARHRNGAYCR